MPRSLAGPASDTKLRGAGEVAVGVVVGAIDVAIGVDGYGRLAIGIGGEKGSGVVINNDSRPLSRLYPPASLIRCSNSSAEAIPRKTKSKL